jgi:hypothetical protein
MEWRRLRAVLDTDAHWASMELWSLSASNHQFLKATVIGA